MWWGAFGTRPRHYGQHNGERAWQSVQEPPTWPPQAPWPPAVEVRDGTATAAKRHRGGWFTKCQQLCEAVIAGNLADARILATMHYAGPTADIAG